MLVVNVGLKVKKNKVKGVRYIVMVTPKFVAKIESEEPTLRLAVLIDADNAQAAVIEGLYADQVAYRELGIGMTGATYAVMPHGPQLDNYADLVDEI